MTNEEYIFQQTSRERKRIGAGAYAKKTEAKQENAPCRRIT